MQKEDNDPCSASSKNPECECVQDFFFLGLQIGYICDMMEISSETKLLGAFL